MRLSSVHDGDEPVPGVLELPLEVALQAQRLAVRQRHHARQRQRHALVLPQEIGYLTDHNTCNKIAILRLFLSHIKQLKSSAERGLKVSSTKGRYTSNGACSERTVKVRTENGIIFVLLGIICFLYAFEAS